MATIPQHLQESPSFWGMYIFVPFHGTFRGSPFNALPWNCMKHSWVSPNFHGIPWNAMEGRWKSMEFHGCPWYFSRTFVNSSVDVHGIFDMKHSMKILHYVSWNIAWKHFMDIHGMHSWTPTKFHGMCHESGQWASTNCFLSARSCGVSMK